MREPIVAITDLLLAAECAVLAGLALRRTRIRAFAWLFAMVGLGALFGAVVHTISESSALASTLWKLTVISIGAAAVSSWVCAWKMWPGDVPRYWKLAIGISFIGYAAFALIGNLDFLVVVGYYAVPALYLLVAFVVRRRWIGAAGMALTFVASAVQQYRALPWMNHNAAYHLLEFVALVLIFAGARD